MTNRYTRKQVQDTVKSLGYKYFSSGNYNVNIIGIRNSNTEGRVTNEFDDLITISYKLDGVWQYHEYDCTTDAGEYYIDNPWLEKGCAVLKPDQYRGSHKLRLHAGKYLALGQKEPVTVYRDRNKNNIYEFDESTCDTGVFGINIHRATALEGKKSTYVDKWSAGCQVIAANDDWHAFLEICQTARDVWGNSFTYTLIESKNIKN